MVDTVEEMTAMIEETGEGPEIEAGIEIAEIDEAVTAEIAAAIVTEVETEIAEIEADANAEIETAAVTEAAATEIEIAIEIIKNAKILASDRAMEKASKVEVIEGKVETTELIDQTSIKTVADQEAQMSPERKEEHQNEHQNINERLTVGQRKAR